MEVKTAALSLATDDYDILGEDLTFLISPKLSVRSEQSNHSVNSSTSNININNGMKVSPIVTDDNQLGSTRPALGSLRGYDEDNNPIYVSSQTPHDYQVLTKRKTSKKSIFNFEGIDMKTEPSSSITSFDQPSHQQHHHFGFSSQFPNVNTGTDGIAYTAKVDIYVKQEVPSADSLDDSKFTFDLNESVPHFLEGINWNSQNSQMNDDGGGPMIMQRQNSYRQPLELNEETSKNPRKKQLGINPVNLNSFQQSTAMAYSEPQGSNYTFQQHQHPAENYQQRWSNNSNVPPSQQTVFNPSYMELPSIRTLQGNSQHLSQFSFPTSIITSTPPTSSSTNYDYESFSNFSSPEHSLPSRVNPQTHNSSTAPTPNHIQDLQSNYHTILQQKVEAMKLSQSPNATDALQHRQLRDHQQKQNQQQVQQFEDDNSKAKNRASKSLAEISRRFVTLYGKDNTMDYISGLVDPDITTEPQTTLNRVDGAAESLGVHVRRIYELIKILEILSLVTFAGDKRGKFSWRGTRDFLYTLGSIQNDGLTRFPQISTEIGLHDVVIDEDPQSQKQNLHVSVSKEDFLLSAASVDGNDLNESSWHDLNQLLNEASLFDIDHQQHIDLMNEVEVPAHKELPVKAKTNVTPLKLKQPEITVSPTKTIHALPVSPSISNEEHFMVEIICKRFLQLFLVGMNHLSMSHVIQKLIPMEKNQTLGEYNKVNATKIRRVYDVTNVLCSLNLIRKKSIPKSKALKAELFNNMDDVSNSQQNSPFPNSDLDSPDFADDDSKASGSKKSTKSARSSSERGEAKVLEWASFSPHIIRLKYLERKRLMLQQQQQK